MTARISEPASALAAMPWRILPLLVVMTGIGPVSLYMLVPMLPMLAVIFKEDISVVQMTVSVYMIGLALSQLTMGTLSDRFGRRPVVMICFGLVIVANIACLYAETLPQLIAGRFLQAIGAASGMVISRAIVRDIYDRNRVSGMISLVVAVMMIAQMVSPLAGGLLNTWFGWRSIFVALAALTTLSVIAFMLALPETRRVVAKTSDSGFAKDARALAASRPFIGYILCHMFSSAIVFTFAGGGPYIVVDQMHRSTTEFALWFATAAIAYMVGNIFSMRLSPRHGLDRMIWVGLALQTAASVVNVIWGVTGLNQWPLWLFGTHFFVLMGCAIAMSNASAGAISVRPQAAGMASGALGFLQMGFGALCSQLGAYLGGHYATPLALNIATLILSLACVVVIFMLVPRSNVFVSAEKMIEAEEQDLV